MGIATRFLNAPHRSSPWFSWGLALFPLVAYSVYLWMHTANLPYSDDVPAVLKAVTDYLSGRNSLIEVLFRRHNEHPILLTRLSSLIQLFLTGEVNFKALALLGNSSLVGIALLLWRTSGLNRAQIIYFAPVCFILFQAQLVSASIWTMVVWSNIMVVFTAFLSLWWLAQPGNRFIWLAVGLLFITVFTNGNGLLLIPAGIVVLFLSRGPTMHWVLWGAVSVVALYFYSQTGEAVALPHLSPTLLLVTLMNWAAFLGAYFSLVAHTLDFLCIGAGLLIGGLLLYYIVTAFIQRGTPVFPNQRVRFHPVLCGMIVFVALSGLSVALLRNEGFDVTQMLYGRYRQYSVVAVCLGYLVALSFIQPKATLFRWFFPAVLIFVAAWNLASYVRYQRFVSYYSRDLWAFMYNMQYNDVALLHTPWYDRTNFTPFFQEAVQKGYYHPPLTDFPAPREILAAVNTGQNVPVPVNEKYLTGEVNAFGCHEKLVLDNYGKAASATDAPGKELYLAFYHKNTVYLIASSTTTPLFRPNGRVNWQAQLPLCRLHPDTYRVSALSIENKKISVNRLAYTLTVPPHTASEESITNDLP